MADTDNDFVNGFYFGIVVTLAFFAIGAIIVTLSQNVIDSRCMGWCHANHENYGLDDKNQCICGDIQTIKLLPTEEK